MLTKAASAAYPGTVVEREEVVMKVQLFSFLRLGTRSR
jgi:hypothetical protein